MREGDERERNQRGDFEDGELAGGGRASLAPVYPVNYTSAADGNYL